jgi:ATP-dependent RNA helicase DDX31/DBP7
MDVGDGLEVNFFNSEKSVDDDLSAFLSGSSGSAKKILLPKPKIKSEQTHPPASPVPSLGEGKKRSTTTSVDSDITNKSKATKSRATTKIPTAERERGGSTAAERVAAALSRGGGHEPIKNGEMSVVSTRQKKNRPESTKPINTFSMDGVIEYDSNRRTGDEDDDDDEYDYVNSLRPVVNGVSQTSSSVFRASHRQEDGAEVESSRTIENDELSTTEASTKTIPLTAPKVKRRRITAAEDPMSFHARPRELALIGQDEASDKAEKAPTTADYIFSQTSFEALHLDTKLVAALTRPLDNGGLNLRTSTVVQSCVLPLFTRNVKGTPKTAQNVLLKSETGSGKTLAFLLPILHGLMNQQKPVKREDGTRAIIISPTRELCAQISNVLSKLTTVCVNIVSGCITGGEKKKSEKARMRKGMVILVATPGRLLDHMQTTDCFNLQHLKYIVLDEADRLLDLGFEKTIMECVSIIRGVKLASSLGSNNNGPAGQSLEKKYAAQQAMIVKKCLKPKELVHIMASATLTLALRRLAMPLMGNQPFHLVDADKQTVKTIRSEADLTADAEGQSSAKRDQSGGDDADADGAKKKKGSSASVAETEQLDAPKQLQQYFMTVSCKWRLAALLSFLKTHSNQKVMVFLATCDSVDFHTLALREAEWPLQLDAEAAGASDGDAGESSNTPSATKEEEIKSKKRIQTLVPLQSKNYGVLGDDCPVFRLHGNIPQRERANTFKDFAAAPRGVLLCTDVAARGLDLPRLDWILQYDPPCEATDYVHRCGRTARRGKAGSSLLFLLPSENLYTTLLANHGLHTEALSLQKLFSDVAAHVPGSAKFKNVEEMAAVILQRRLERTIEACQPLLLAARQAFRSHVRAYATHSKESKGIFRVASLHLGHVARSFALRDPPKAGGSMGASAEDVLARIHNGVYNPKKDGAVSELSRDEKKRARDEKYSLSGNSKSSKAANSTAPKGKKRQRTDDIADAIQSMSKQQIQQQTVREMKKEKSKRKWDNAQNLQKLRPISSGGAARNRPSASYSTARPKIGGHAQRQRAQASSEFAQG